MKTPQLKIESLRALGLLQFLEMARLFCEKDADLIRLKSVSFENSKHIRRALGIDLIRNQEIVSGIKILNRLLSLLGLKLKQTNDDFYEVDQEILNDGRKEIFDIWHQRDELMLSHLRKNISQPVEFSAVESKNLLAVSVF